MKRFLLGGCATLALGFTAIAPAAALPPRQYHPHPWVWFSEHSSSGAGNYSWLVAYSAASVRGMEPPSGPAAIIDVPNDTLENVAADRAGDVFARRTQSRVEPNGFDWFRPGANGLTSPTVVLVGRGTIGELASDSYGFVYTFLYPKVGALPSVMISDTIEPRIPVRPLVTFTPGPTTNTTVNASVAEAISPGGVVAQANNLTGQYPSTINLITSSGINPANGPNPAGQPVFTSTDTTIGGLAFDLQGNLYALVSRGGATSLLEFYAGEGLRHAALAHAFAGSWTPGPDSLAIDDAGYAYVLGPKNDVLVLAPASGGHQLVNDWRCCPGRTMAPRGVRGNAVPAPNNVPKSIAVER